MRNDLEFDADLLMRYDVAGPRYTSYPTAPNFGTGFRAEDYRRHARASNDDPVPRPLSLYLHVPFCTSPCFYCGCTRVITRDLSRSVGYLERVSRELAMHAELFDPDRQLLQLHLGGGTPNFLDLDQFRALFARLSSHFPFAPADEREFSIELDPRGATPDLIGGLAELGFNRMSFGVQDFDREVQEAINRVQSVEETLGAMRAARDAGVQSVSFDLIYGLPRQTNAGFGQTLSTVLDARPDRIALYSYAHLPELFKAQRQIDPADMPTAPAKLALLGMAIERLGAAGYRYIGMDHFALPGDELVRAQEQGSLQRNFQGYSTHAECDLVGLGVSSIGSVGDCYAQNARDLAGYYAMIDAGHLAVQRGLTLTPDDQLRRELIQQIMCHGSLEFDAVEARHGFDFAERFPAELERLGQLARDGLVTLDDRGLVVTARGRLLIRHVAMAFDAYLRRPAPSPARYSRVI